MAASAAAIRWPCAARRSPVLFALLATIFFAAAGCARLRAPVEPAAVRFATGEQLRAAMDSLYPPPNAFYARAEIAAKGRLFLGGGDLTIQMLCRPPDRAVVQVGQPGLIGGILRLTQSGQGVALYLLKEGRHYAGDVGQLDARPEIFFGIEPLDLARVMTAGRDAANALANGARDGWTLRKPCRFGRHWALRARLDSRRSVEYRIRERDALVVEARLLDAKGRWIARADYRAYERSEGALFPSRFDLRLRRGGGRARVEIRALEPNRAPRDKDFFLAPPPGVESATLREGLRHFAP